MDESGISYTEPLLFLVWLLFSIILFFIIRKIYWKVKGEQGKKETEKLMEEMKKWWNEKHAEHVKGGVEYNEHCEICRGLWK